MVNGNRWYDAYPELSTCFDILKQKKPFIRSKIAQELLHYLQTKNPGIIENNVLKFPLDILTRRWYDQSPYLWLLVNGLKYATQEQINITTDLFKELLSGDIA